MKSCVLLLVPMLLLNERSRAADGPASRGVLSPRLECKMRKNGNGTPTIKVQAKKGEVKFDISYSTMDCGSQSYELKAKDDSLIIVQCDKMETCQKHKTMYSLVGKIEGLQRGGYSLNVVQSIGREIRYSLIKQPIKVEVP